MKEPIARKFTTVAGYDARDDLTNLPELVNFRDVLDALAEGRRDGLILDKYGDYVRRWEKLADYDAVATDLLSGTSEYKFTLSLVAATDEAGKKITMPVLFDTLLDTTLVVGPGKISAAALDALGKANVTYVDRNDPGAIEKINEHVIAAARERGDRALIDPVGAYALVNGFATALEKSGTLAHAVQDGTSVGTILLESAQSKAQPKVFVAAVKPKTPV